jgi:predicted Rossmann fold flavoprotein
VKIRKIAIIGAGPAGMMAAIRASSLKQGVTLFERNPTLGKKLLLSGKGRCNITNACDLGAFLEKFSGNGQFLRDAFNKFFNRDLMEFFSQRGLELKTERQLRVFPVTDSSASVLNVLKRELAANKVDLRCNCRVKAVLVENNAVKGLLFSDGKEFPCDKVILATGGLSYSFTGSSGDGLAIASKLGHQIVPLRPALAPLIIRQEYPKMLEGLTLKNISFKVSDRQKEIASDIGELLFTGQGISGPLIFSLSAKIGKWLQQGKALSLKIDLKPALSLKQLDERLLREFKANPKKNLKNTLKTLLPQSLIAVFIKILKLDPEKKVSQATQAERLAIANLLKAFSMDIAGLAPIEEGMATAGGVSLKEINPRTMESRLIKGLYFAGEIIDVDADTGGFNLQAAFSTGYLAGESAGLS